MRKRYLLLALTPLLAAGALAAGLMPMARNPLLPDPEEQVDGRASSIAKAPATGGHDLHAAGTASRDASAGAAARRFGIDIARIDPNGGSVIAGHAEPNARITVLANGRPIGNATADAAGDWTLVTSHRFVGDNPNLTVVPDDARNRVAAATTDTFRRDLHSTQHSAQRSATAETRAGTVSDAVAARTRNGAANRDAGDPNSGRPTAADVTQQMLDRIRTLTRQAEARGGQPDGTDGGTGRSAGGAADGLAQAQAQAPAGQAAGPVTMLNVPNGPAQGQPLAVAATAPKPGQPQSGLQPIRAATAAATPLTVVSAAASVADVDRPARRTANLPVPVQFVYREATFTDQGQEAAQALLDYIKAKRFAAVSLSGHADERGTPAANLDLSAKRLERIERFLRDGGYQGKLTLVPKGEGEDYPGVDRSRFSIDDLYQLDRRVEVIAAE